MSSTSPLIRMIPLQPSELPAHPALISTNSEAESAKRPDLLPFACTLLDSASSILDPTAFNLTFKSHSHRPAPPSNTQVEALTATIPSSTISEIKWSEPDRLTGIGRAKPREIPTENWFARRSYHANVSSKVSPATANWEEFVFGLRDNHSKNEAEFTPTLYDARHILDWNAELAIAVEQWKVNDRSGETPGQRSYTDITLAVYEMCHEVPFPLQPRCFPVLVVTASSAPNTFVAATVPVNLSSFEGAFYSNGRNRTEGEDAMRRKQIVLGIYTAVEKVEVSERTAEAPKEAATKTEDGDHVAGKKEQMIEWIMATASDARGNLPMLLQKSSMPGMVVKDVGYFLNWIHTVEDEVVQGKQPQVFTNDVNAQRKSSGVGSVKGDRRKSSSAR